MCTKRALGKSFSGLILFVFVFFFIAHAQNAQAQAYSDQFQPAGHTGALEPKGLEQYPGFIQTEGTVGQMPGSQFLLRCGIDGQGRPDAGYSDFTYANPAQSVFTDQQIIGSTFVTTRVDPRDINNKVSRRLMVQFQGPSSPAVAGNCAINTQTQNYEDCHTIPPFATAAEVSQELQTLNQRCSGFYGQVAQKMDPSQFNQAKSDEWRGLMAQKLSALRQQLGQP